jgi:hypothetical protein
MAGVDSQDVALAGARSAVSSSPTPYTLSAAIQANGTRAAIARATMAAASLGLVANSTACGTCAAFSRAGSDVQAFGRYRARSMKACPLADTLEANTPIWCRSLNLI